MAEKQTPDMETTNETSNQNLLQRKVEDLMTNYNESQLRDLLKEHGLDKMPLAAHTKKVLMKKLAQRILDLNPDTDSLQESELTQDQDAAPRKSSMNVLDVPHKLVSRTETDDMRKNLVEARESLTSCLSDASKTHYAVCIPGTVNTITVQSDFREVLKMMKEHKSENPRMLSFPCLADAQEFVNNHTANEVCEGANIKSSYPQEKAVDVGEVKLFPSPTPPQINEFRIQLEKGNINFARERMLTNPRFLIGNGDMPTILKEGTRYNAMHACVIANQLESCRLVMEMVSDVEYLKRMYGTSKRAEENSKRLIDLYLNTPDKLAHKTPLHFASERGMVDIVAFLVSFKACIRNFNRHITVTVKEGDKQIETSSCTGKTPEEVACSRYNGPNAASVKAKIIALIQGGTCYVPLIRSDTTGPYAKVGDPYAPTSPYKLVEEIEDVFKPSPTADPEHDMKDFRNMKVWAYAGPMSPQEAQEFRKEWKSPRLKRHDLSIRENLKVKDGDRGFEHFGRELAEVHATSWQEYWPFLDAFADLRSEEGLEKLEQFFQKQRVLIMIQALLKEQEFVSAPPYHVGAEYILGSEGDDSGAENDHFFSADSQSCSEEEDEASPETRSNTGKDSSETDTQPKTSGGVFSSLWSGLSKLKSYLSPSSVKASRNQNTSISADFKLEQGHSENSNNNESGSKFTKPSKSDLKGSETEDLNLDPSKKKTVYSQANKACDKYDETKKSTSLNDSSISTASALKCSPGVGHDAKPSADPPDDGSSETLQSSSCSSASVVLSPVKSEKDTEDSCSLGSGSKGSRGESSERGCAPVQSLDQWNYRTPAAHVESPEKVSPGSEGRSDDYPISPSLNIDIGASPVGLGGTTINMRGGFQQKGSVQQEMDRPTQQSSDSPLSNSFNTKMESFCEGLEKFSIISPVSSSAATNLTKQTSLSGPDDFTSATEASIHIFTGSSFGQLSSELSSRKLITSDSRTAECGAAVPTLFLRQADDQETLLVDVFLTQPERTENALSKAHGSILDEETHREATKNVWINFLAIFPTSYEAKRFSSLSRDETVRAVVEGIAEDKDAFAMSSCGKTDYKSMKELFMKSRDVEASIKSVALDVRIVRVSTVPCKNVYACGTIATKVDADVYHTLNNKACQLIYDQAHRFPLISQWLDNMVKPGKDFINSLPSPSRVLRSERRKLPLISPLVKNEMLSTPKTRSSIPVAGFSPGPTKDIRKEDPVIRTLFRSSNEDDE